MEQGEMATALRRLGYQEGSVKRLKEEWCNTLHAFPDFSWEVDVFYDTRGTPLCQMKVTGTVWGTPVTLWVPQEYPAAPPACYVTPASPAQEFSRGHPHMELGGRVVVKGWNPAWSLQAYLTALRAIFTAFPPLKRAVPFQKVLASPYASAPATPASPEVLAEALEKKLRVRCGAETAHARRHAACLETYGRKLLASIGAAGSNERKSGRLLARTRHEILDLQEEVRNLQSWLDRTGPKIPMDADHLKPADPLSCQALGLLAESSALDDFFLVLDRQLAAGKLYPAQYVSKVSSAAAQQFHIKALLNKISDLQQRAPARR